MALAIFFSLFAQMSESVDIAVYEERKISFTIIRCRVWFTNESRFSIDSQLVDVEHSLWRSRNSIKNVKMAL